MTGSLGGLGVLVTRPEHQAEGLCRSIERRGGRAIRCPTVTIREPRDWAPALASFDRLADCDLAIFTSANAVDRAMPAIDARGGFPPGLELAAIGNATAQALRRHGATHILHPEAGFTSEALLALPRLQAVAGQTVLIARGEGGRTLLADTLAARGARVVPAEVYRREKPAADVEKLLECWARGEIGAVVVTSGESLRNLFDLCGGEGQDYLRETPLIVASARIQHAAATLGCRRLQLARDASDDAIVAALSRLTPLFPLPAR